MTTKVWRSPGLLCAIIAAMGLNAAQASNVSFTGQFDGDDGVALFALTVAGNPSLVTLRSWSYAGGWNAAGTPIAEGGFDPILALFDQGGMLIAQNDDGASVSASHVTGLAYDTFLTISLDPGIYYAGLTEYRNSANGPNLGDGFLRTGEPTFTSRYGCSNGQFCDLAGHNRTSGWAFDILNVDAANVVTGTTSVVPVLPAAWLFGSAVGLLGLIRRKVG